MTRCALTLCAFAALVAAWAPQWPATYDMAQSTLIQPCNNSGSTPAGFAPWAIVDYDWSESKSIWSAARPMNCEETMLRIAEETHQLNPSGRVWVYRNSIKALPWFTSIREKLTDRAYWPWFLANKGCNPAPGVYTCGPNATTNLYHDFEQTPHGDCGVGIECGEYLFDLRNATLRAWLAGDYLLSPTGLGSPAVHGFFFDDNWSMNGPSEEDSGAVNATGLSKADVADLTAAWNASITGMINASIAHGGFVWQALLDGGGQTAPGRDQSDPRANCAGWLRANCGPAAPFLAPGAALFFGFTRINHSTPLPLPAFEQDLATFLLVRGDYAWLGFGWVGCNRDYPYPAALAADYGVPTGTCAETAPGSGVFTREWSKASVQMDCNAWQGTITMKQ